MDLALACDGVDVNVQSQFDQFYTVAIQLLDMFYPECSVTVTRVLQAMNCVNMLTTYVIIPAVNVDTRTSPR